MRGYIYRRKENKEYENSRKPEDIGMREEVMKWEVLRGLLGKRYKRRKIKRKMGKGAIAGIMVEEKGVRGRRRKSSKRRRVIGDVKRKSKDGVWERRDIKIKSRRGMRVRRIWIGMKPLPNSSDAYYMRRESSE